MRQWIRPGPRRRAFQGLAALSALGGIPVSSPAAQALELEIENGTPWSITELYLAPAASNDFRHNALHQEDGAPVDPDYTFTITDIGPGLYDLRVVSLAGDACILRNIDLARSRAIVVAENGGGTCVELPHPALQTVPTE